MECPIRDAAITALDRDGVPAAFVEMPVDEVTGGVERPGGHVQREDLQTVCFFNQAIELDKGNTEPAHQRSAQCGLVGLPQTNQRDAFQAADGIYFAKVMEQKLPRRFCVTRLRSPPKYRR